MKKFLIKPIISLIFVLFIIISCNQKFDNNIIEIHNSNFNNVIAKKYHTIAIKCAKSQHWSDAEKFSLKALDAYNKNKISPEDPRYWQNKNFEFSEMLTIHHQINKMINKNNIIYHAEKLANLITSYDYLLFVSKKIHDYQQINLAQAELYHNLANFDYNWLSSIEVDRVIVLTFAPIQDILTDYQKSILVHNLSKKNYKKTILRTHHYPNHKLLVKQLKLVTDQLKNYGIKKEQIEIIKYPNIKNKSHRVKVDFIKN